MTKDEIKATTTMEEVLSRYGVHVARKMCSCPLHGLDRHPSMQVFKDGFKCHTCGAYGDIFDFVMRMENCSFKEAFKILGGEYDHDSGVERKKRLSKFAREKEERERSEKAAGDFKQMLSFTITVCRRVIDVCEPMNDMWADAQQYLPVLLHIWEEKYINESEVDELNVFRKCRAINKRFGVG